MKSFLLLIAVLLILQVSGQDKNVFNKKLAPGLPVLTGKMDLNIQQPYFVVATEFSLLKHYLVEKNLGSNIISEYRASNLLVVRLNWNQVDSLLSNLPLVKFIDIVRVPKEETAIDGFDLSKNKINLVHNEFFSLNGKGTSVSVKENKPDINDIDLRGRLTLSSFSSTQTTSHATIVSTIIAGAGNSYYTGKGVAWGAEIISSNFASLLPDADSHYKQYQISVQNHSYGTGIESYYGPDAAAFDASTVSNPSLLHVFSSGNSGDKSSTTGIYAGINGYANLTGSFKMAKNVITVGATDSFNNIAVLSSRGPAHDGRVRPELVAFGQDGSSGAAALVSGTALLLQQAYKEKNAGQLAPAPLVKAILLNTADDVGQTGIDFLSGYGSLNAYQAVQGMVNQQYFSNSIAAGEVQNFTLHVPANVQRLKITICWNDLPASPNDNKALLNDIDFKLIHAVTGSTWLPWVLNSFPHKDSLLQLAARKKDSLNNTEQITVDHPSQGIYSIEVHGYNIQPGSQPYYISYQLDLSDQFKWEYPTKADYMFAGSKNTLRWASSFTGLPGKLFYSTDSGNNWNLLAENLNLSTGYFQWSAPDTFSTVIFRMQISNRNFLSDTSTISSSVSTSVGFNCRDSFLIYWARAQNVSSYIVYQLGNRYMEPLKETLDSSILLQKSANPSLYYAVAPSISGKPAVKSYTFNYSTQGVGCYIKSFLVDLNSRNGNIQLELGTGYNIKDIVIEKMARDSFIALKTIFFPSALQYSFVDNSLVTGGNSYRLRLDLNDGSKVYSNIETIFYLADMTYLVYPNPSNGIFHVVSGNAEDADLFLFNSLGQQVFAQKLTSTIQRLSVPRLKKGLYFIQIRQKGSKVFKGSIVVQ